MASTHQLVKTSEDQTLIAKWSKHCIAHKLYMPDRFAIKCFNGDFTIKRMSILLTIGWAMIHDYPDKEAQVSVFVTEKHRLHGLGRSLLRAVLTEYTGPPACADYKAARTFFTKCHKCIKS